MLFINIVIKNMLDILYILILDIICMNMFLKMDWIVSKLEKGLILF